QFVLHKHLADWGCTDQWSRALGAESSTQEETMQARWSINITPIERGARIVLGLLGVVGGEILLSQADSTGAVIVERSEEHTSELQSRFDLVCRLLLEKKKTLA